MTVVTAITQCQFRDAVACAIRAPSVYNVQPWRFALRDGAIEIRIDPARALPVADPDGWAARIACGAALTNIELSLAAAGTAVETELWPEPGNRRWVATVTATGADRAMPPADRALHEAIGIRRSNRRPFFDAPVPADARARLQDAAIGTGAWLAVVAGREPVARIAAIVHDADRRLRGDAAYVAEMRRWLGRDDGTGISAEAAGTAPGGQDLLAMRDFGGTTRAEGRDFESDPLLVIVGTPGDGRFHDVAAGRALQRLLLIATGQRLATSMLSQPIEVAAARADLRRALRPHGTPQMIVRVGYGQPCGATARRPVDRVIDRAAPTVPPPAAAAPVPVRALRP